MSLDPQKQQLVYDLFLEAIRQSSLMGKVRFDDANSNLFKAETINDFQKLYNRCKNLVQTLEL